MKNQLLLLAIAVVLCVPAGAGAMNTLICLNTQRAYDGLPPLKHDPELQLRAQFGAYQRSLRGMNGHLKKRHLWRGQEMLGSFGRWEGTARRNSHKRPYNKRTRKHYGELWGPEDVYACYQNHPRATHAGFASVLGADGFWYYQGNYR